MQPLRQCSVVGEDWGNDVTRLKLTFGPTRYFVPVCVRYPHGFVGGPDGYEETEDKDAKTIIVEARTQTEKGVE